MTIPQEPAAHILPVHPPLETPEIFEYSPAFTLLSNDHRSPVAYTEFVEDFLAFLRASPTPFHAVANIAGRLERSGFVRLREHEDWRLDQDGRYYVVRNGSSIVAFSNTGKPGTRGIRMVGAHTDSPCLKVKPRPERVKNGYFQLSAEVYGGALLNPWFDRDLSVAGRVTLQTGDRSLVHRLIDFERPLAVIPSLAIHLDRDANNARSINAQTDIVPLLMRTSEEMFELRSLLADRLAKEHPDYASAEILDFELCLYDTQPPAVVGVKDEFISGARLDNLASCFIAMRAIIDHEHTYPALMVCNDHEEVGSQSAVGADGPFLRDVIHRWLGDRSTMAGAMDSSLLVSADNAHGVHPNYPDKHDENHGPVLNGGPVIKVNQSQRYATNSETGSIFRTICLTAEVPVQSFVSRADMACGTTIGPITAGGVGVKTVDVGIPQLAMHSIRETCGAADPEYLYRALKAFFDTEQLQAAEAF